MDATCRLQSNSGLLTGTAIPVTLPDPTSDGSTLLLFIGTGGSGTISILAQSFDPPWFQDQAHAGNWFAWRRPNQPAGETSWAITAAISAPYYWRAEEWAGLSTIGQPDASGNIETQVSTLTLATDRLHPGNCTTDVADFAALAVFRASFAGASGWPAAHSYGAGVNDGPSSWTEVGWLVNGDGTGSSDFILAIAEAYPGTAGAVAGALTFDTSGGGGTPASMDAWAVCYQPDVPDQPAGILTS